MGMSMSTHRTDANAEERMIGLVAAAWLLGDWCSDLPTDALSATGSIGRSGARPIRFLRKS